MADENLKSAFDQQAVPVTIEQFDPEIIPVEAAVEPQTETMEPLESHTASEEIKSDVATQVHPDDKSAAVIDPPADIKKEQTFFEKLKGSDVKIPEQVVPELPNDIKQKLEEYEKITSSDIFKLLNGEKDLTKVDLKELGKKLAGEDFSKLDINDILQRTLKLEYPNISDTDLEKAVESRALQFTNLEEWEQNLNRQKLVDVLSKNHKPDDVFQTLETIKKSQSVNTAEDQKKAIETYRQQITTLYEDLAKQAIGQEYQGYVMSEEDGKATISEFNDNVQNFTPEKNFLRMLKAATYDKAVEAAEKRGYEKAIIEKGKPDFGKTGMPVIQPKTPEGLKNVSLQEFFNEFQPG